ncbi:SPRY domain-containing protein [Paenibacillus xylanexedens]|uniref:SPRY domain-containing protein n=1 Tax=Paenibacillus xylanexedens TaxID=528191 RepID=UPI0011A5758E|nr:SPRY domain-containing protein [Paenibacillus xylanexedens]
MAIELTYLNPSDVSGTITLSNNNLTASMPSGSIIRGNYAHTKGKYYFEVKLDSGATTLQFGIATKSISIPAPTSVYVRCINGSNGNRYPENTSYGTGWVVGDVIGVAMDLDSGKLEFYKNGVNLGISHTDLISLINQYGEIVPYFRSGGTTPVITVNFGATAFKYTMPSGYNPYNYAYSNKFLISSEDKYYSLLVKESVNQVPIMASNILPSGEVSASSTYSTGNEWRAFDRVPSTVWQSNNIGTNQWLTYKFTTPIRITSYSLSTRSLANLAPRDFKLQGSNNGVDYTDLDSQTNVTDWVADVKKTYQFTNSFEYLYYRIFVVANNGGNSVLISEFELMNKEEKTMLTIPKLSDTNFLKYGMNKSFNIITDSNFDKLSHVADTSEALGSGKVFKQKINTSKTPIKKVSIT